VNVPAVTHSLDHVNQAIWAEDLARKLLEAPLPRRWAHVQGVAAQARSLVNVLGHHADLVEAAAWLHDIGYSPTLADTGFHPLDGARYLRDVHHADAMLSRLVAHHSCAVIEAEERGLAAALLAEFEPAPEYLANALTCCDMTTSPDGDKVHVSDRLCEIHNRYGPAHLVSRSIRRATPRIIDAVTSTRLRSALATV
jgi:predicted hydrolase (HD superfamily)